MTRADLPWTAAKRCRSLTSTTGSPMRASPMAAAAPKGPAPMITMLSAARYPPRVVHTVAAGLHHQPVLQSVSVPAIREMSRRKPVEPCAGHAAIEWSHMGAEIGLRGPDCGDFIERAVHRRPHAPGAVSASRG